jgi:hypothetical protein
MTELIWGGGKGTISLYGCSAEKPHYYKTNNKPDQGYERRILLKYYNISFIIKYRSLQKGHTLIYVLFKKNLLLSTFHTMHWVYKITIFNLRRSVH